KALNQVLAAKDTETRGHSERVATYALKLGQVLGLDSPCLVGLEQGALLHDIGKVAVPDAILLKPGPLSADEQRVMRGHVQHGLAIVRNVPLLSEAAHVIGEHHERFDGTGYPNQLCGDQIHIFARVFALADALDALLSNRPYRPSQPYCVARQEIERSVGSHFDPHVVRAFLTVPQEVWFTLREDTSSRQFTSRLIDTAGARTALRQMASC
ncbi:MAG: HD-GYP domain-containing protein, partial [Blastocatellia bacterium]